MPIAATESSLVAKNIRSASPLPPANSLRILIVDDNHINLSILSTLLKRRFGHALSRPPVSLDSGLKALQLLRTEIFDLIFMDIEMPYLDGVECTRRIRAGEDGILDPNRNAHIVAVTTNVGPEPGSLYRHVGMDGMISKPVRFENFHQYICPLSIEASAAKGSVSPVLVGAEEVLPPMPPIDLEQRLFFVPAPNGGVVTTSKSSTRGGDSPTPEYSNANEFAAMLKAQTAKSLRDRKALSISRSTTLSEARRSSFNSPRSEHLSAIRVVHQPGAVDSDDALATEDRESFRRKHGAGQDITNASMLSFESLVERETRERELDCLTQSRVPTLVRPVPIHRVSSPAYLLDASPVSRLRAEPAMRSNPDLAAPRAVRPGIRPLPRERPVRNDSDRSSNSASDSAGMSAYVFSSDHTTTTTRRSSSLDLLSSFEGHRTVSPSSSLTTPVSSPADMDAIANAKDLDDDHDRRDAVFSPCADDLLVPRGLDFRTMPLLPPFPPLSSKAMSLQNSPRIRVSAVPELQQARSRDGLSSRVDALHLE
ncbi:histidine kinase [Pseudozyma hubeiensis SY62]|uniref:Histidine kinase n=1 Tax=Pseudozyma hubeiensis (strain SY62) TaxID=1305764 RepID=R9P1D4_PSEHS|nr:histidine kinase [Pseudozyma hubeiensis SY62]GAC94917.1 histidine kinase [Pseudozyma hubeiensis SY62]